MIKEKIKKTIKKAKRCGEFVQTTSIAIVLALVIVAKSQRHPTPRKNVKKK
jgi:hypothetical protein|tara:strand:+ start:998 stop:1150 length:153 start_codon:yes stop_codon:yes gene_type:complete